jgi:ribosomal RNA-processing protein 1
MSSILATDESTVTFARALVCPDKVTRDKSVQSLIRYVSVLQEITEMEMLKLWKALHYCMWLADKTAIQMELAEGLSKLLTSFKNDDLALLYIRIFFRTMIREWTLLDQHRINKFYTLIRFMLREGLLFLQRNDWQNDSVDDFLNILEEEVMTKTPNGLRLHLADIFLPELVTITMGEISTDAFTRLLRPFFAAAQGCLDTSFQERVSNKVFRAFARTHAREHRGGMDGVGGGDGDGGDGQQLFLNVRTSTVQAMIFEAASDADTAEKNRRRLYLLHQEFPSLTGLAFASMDDEGTEEIEIVTKVDKKIRFDPVQKNAVESSTVDISVSAETEIDSRSAAASLHVGTVKKAKILPNKDASPNKNVESSHQKVNKKRKADSINADASVSTSVSTSERAKSSSHPRSSTESDSDPMPEANMIYIPSALAFREEAEAAVAAAPFIASARFTGEKACYVFKRGRSGQGYYRDEIRVKRHAKVSGSKKANLTKPARLTQPAHVAFAVATTIIPDSQEKKRVKRESADRRKSSDFPPAESVRVDDLTGEGEGRGDRKVTFGKPQSKGETGQDSDCVCSVYVCSDCVCSVCTSEADQHCNVLYFTVMYCIPL